MARQEPDRGSRRRWFRLPMQSPHRDDDPGEARRNESEAPVSSAESPAEQVPAPGVAVEDSASAPASGESETGAPQTETVEEIDDSMTLPRVISIANQKGGVGKTTTAVNLGAALAELDYRVLVIDLDPQGNATTGMGISHRNVEGSIYDVIMNDAPIDDCTEPTTVKNLFVVPATIDLAGPRSSSSRRSRVS
jgi:chromosome partitioning protein